MESTCIDVREVRRLGCGRARESGDRGGSEDVMLCARDAAAAAAAAAPKSELLEVTLELGASSA